MFWKRLLLSSLETYHPAHFSQRRRSGYTSFVWVWNLVSYFKENKLHGKAFGPKKHEVCDIYNKERRASFLG
jgi:hypothetical protein